MQGAAAMSLAFSIACGSARADASADPPAAAGGSAAQHYRDERSSERSDPRAKNARDDDDVTIGGELDVVSRATWRGMALSDAAAAEPSAWIEAYGFGASVDAMIARHDDPARGAATAVVPSIACALHWDSFRIDPSVTLYRLDAGAGATTTVETAVEASISRGNFRVFTTHAIDVASHVGSWFGVVGGELEIARGPWIFTARGDVGVANPAFNAAYFRIAELDLDVVEARVAARRSLDRAVYADVHFDVSTLLAPTLRAAVATPTLWSIGLAIGFER